jgi:mono/diheme cytochrome c family protein
LVYLVPLVMIAFLGVVGRFMFIGPRMRVMPHIRAFQAVMPASPEGSVPLYDPVTTAPTSQAAAAMHNPLPVTSANLARGEVYYGYYCLQCHGEKGDGRGPVGESFFPVPADLRGKQVQAMSDGQLLRGMLVGIGHEPVLGRIVEPDARWPLVLYVRWLGEKKP